MRRYRPSGFRSVRAAAVCCTSSLTSGDMNATPIFRLSPATSVPRVHRRKERFACIVTHRRAGKTVAASTAQAQPRARLELPRGHAFRYLAMTLDRTVSVRNPREAWSTQTSASSDLSINVRRVGKGALCAPCPPLATDRVGTARAVKLASRNDSARAPLPTLVWGLSRGNSGRAASSSRRTRRSRGWITGP